MGERERGRERERERRMEGGREGGREREKERERERENFLPSPSLFLGAALDWNWRVQGDVLHNWSTHATR